MRASSIILSLGMFFGSSIAHAGWQATPGISTNDNSSTGLLVAGFLDKLKEFDEKLKDIVDDQFPEASDEAQSFENQSGSAASGLSDPDVEQLFGLWEAEPVCYVHFYRTFDGQLGGAVWDRNGGSSELAITPSEDRRFEWKRTTRKSHSNFPAKSGRFIVDSNDRQILYSNLAPCYFPTGSSIKWQRIDPPESVESLFPEWYQAVLEGVASDTAEHLKRKEAESLEAKKQAEEKQRREAEAKQVQLTIRAQQLLAELGLYEKALDGELGPATLAALQKWAADEGREVPSEINEALISELEQSVSSEEIRKAELAKAEEAAEKEKTELGEEIQLALTAFGLYSGPVNGILISNSTQSALKTWARSNSYVLPSDYSLVEIRRLNDAVAESLRKQKDIEKAAEQERLAREALERQQRIEEREKLEAEAAELVETVEAFIKATPETKFLLEYIRYVSVIKKGLKEQTNTELKENVDALGEAVLGDSEFLAYVEKRNAEEAAQAKQAQVREEKRLAEEQVALLESGKQLIPTLRRYLVENVTSPDIASWADKLDDLQRAVDAEDYDELRAIVPGLLQNFGASSEANDAESSESARPAESEMVEAQPGTIETVKVEKNTEEAVSLANTMDQTTSAGSSERGDLAVNLKNRCIVPLRLCRTQ